LLDSLLQEIIYTMAYLWNLKRNPALTNDFIGTTLGTATLQSKDNASVQVPLAPLLSTSKLIRTIVAESHLHPAIHGPLILSCEVSTEALVSVGNILGAGDTRINNDNIEEVKHLLTMLGVDADVSQDRENREYFEQLSARNEVVKLEIVFEMQDNENCTSAEEIISRVNDIGNEDQLGFDITGKEKDKNNNRRNSVREHDAINSEEMTVKLEIDEDNCDIVDHDRNYAVRNCEVKVHKMRKFHDKANHTDKTYEKEKLLKCKVCHYSASAPSVLKIHMRSHTGEKPFTCAICSTAFRQKQHLKEHMKRHTGERPFTCAICSSDFPRKHYLKYHMRRHTGEKPYACAICSTAFRQKQYLKNHMRRHTGEKPYSCALCASDFSHKASLSLHMRKHTGEKSSKCDSASTTSEEFQ